MRSNFIENSSQLFQYYRPTEVETLLGDATKAKNELGWEAKIPIEVRSSLLDFLPFSMTEYGDFRTSSRRWWPLMLH